MKHLCPIPLCILILCILFALPALGQKIAVVGIPIQVCFTPGEDCTHEIVDEINHARSIIYLQAYSFTSKPIAQALARAHKRGVKIEAVLDKSQRSERYTSASFLSASGIATYIDDKHAIAHNKIIIIDDSTTITGSFNFTKAAQERNAENLVIIRSKEVSRAYVDNWLLHRDHSGRYVPRY